MSHPVPRERVLPLDERHDAHPASHADSAAPESFAQPQAPAQSPIDREIDRSRRASAALAASAAVARAAFTDSELEAEAAAAQAVEGDDDATAWIRTEYAALDHSPPPHASFDEHAAADALRSRATAHNPVRGTFDPGLAALHGRTFAAGAGPRIGVPIHTRGGAQARFRQESRQTPRAERGQPFEPREPAHEQHPEAPNSRYDKAEVMPMLATPAAGTTAASVPRRGSETAKFALAIALGAVAAVMAGGVAWKQGLLTPGGSPSDSNLVTASVARQAEAARVMAAAEHQLQDAPPAAGVLPAPASPQPEAATAPAPGKASAADIDAALAAAERVAPSGRAQPAAPERVLAQASWPATASPGAQAAPAAPAAVVEPATTIKPAAPVAPVHPVVPLVARPVAPFAVAARPQPPVAPVAHETAQSRDAVAQAVARAQARADSFLSGTGPAPSPSKP